MERRPMSIKSATESERARIYLANVSEPSDWTALNLRYHRYCLRDYERKAQASSNLPLDIIQTLKGILLTIIA